MEHGIFVEPLIWNPRICKNKAMRVENFSKETNKKQRKFKFGLKGQD